MCCQHISLPANEQSPHGNRNPLGDVIARASSKDNPSWCTCSEEVLISFRGICCGILQHVAFCRVGTATPLQMQVVTMCGSKASRLLPTLPSSVTTSPPICMECWLHHVRSA